MSRPHTAADVSMLARCDILADEDAVDFVAALLSARVSSGWEEQHVGADKICFVLHAPGEPGFSFLQQLADDLRAFVPSLEITLNRVKDEDWQRVWREFFIPIPCGARFLVLPPWLEAEARDSARLPIVIEPRSAFGTGHHASTALCLTALSELTDAGRIVPGMQFLDLGTGSGILGIGCCRLGLEGVGLDTDPLAIENALENRERNRCPAFELHVGSLELAVDRRFNLVLANILAEPLKEMAPEIIRLLKENACLVLSGILASQGDAVEAAYMSAGLGPARRLYEDEWVALIWENTRA